MSRILWCAGALALAACSPSVESQGAGDETGGLRVSVHDLTEAQVKEVHLELLPDNGEPNPAPGQLRIVLRPTDPNVRDDSGPYVVWTWSAEDLPGGAYLITAKAYDQANPQLGFGVLPIFESIAVPAQVQGSPTATVSLFLRQGVGQGDFEPPHVTAVRFDQKPEQAAVSRISVWGNGGEGALSLKATGPGNLGLRGPPATWNGEGNGNARDPGGAFIDWIPNASGNLALSLILEDGDGNRSTLVLLVDVDAARGDIAFAISFNHAPWSVLHSDSLVNPPTMSIELTARYGDVESDTALVDYEWDVSDCEDKLFVASPPATQGVVSGSIVGDESTSHKVTLSLTATPLRDPPPICEVILEVSDRGLPGDATAISKSARSILITLGQVHPCFGDLASCGGVCVDLEEDQNNCGACGNVCGSGQTCTAGACLCDEEELTACGQLCVDLQNDKDHCGACDEACGAGLVCEIGECDFPTPVPVGSYDYKTKVVAGLTDPKFGAWHPSGKYALVLEATNRVLKYQPSNASLTEVANEAGFTWKGLTFSQDGSKAVLYGEQTAPGTQHPGRIYVWDDATQKLLVHPNGTHNNSRFVDHAWSPDGELWLFAWNGLTSTSARALTWRFDFNSGPVLRGSVVPSSAPCSRMAWSKDQLGDDLIVFLCNGYLAYMYPGASSQVTSVNHGSGTELMGRPQGDYVFAWRSSASADVMRFNAGAWSTVSNVLPSTILHRPLRLSFSPNGKRALFLRSRAGSESGRVLEYRHDLLSRAQVTDVFIPPGEFAQNGWEVHLNEAVWRPGCDEGIILGGNTGSNASGYIIEFKIINGRACPP